MKDILTAITELREQRNWTEYQLAERSGLPQSTISSWFRKGMIPTVPSLEKVVWLLESHSLNFLQREMNLLL